MLYSHDENLKNTIGECVYDSMRRELCVESLVYKHRIIFRDSDVASEIETCLFVVFLNHLVVLDGETQLSVMVGICFSLIDFSLN